MAARRQVLEAKKQMLVMSRRVFRTAEQQLLYPAGGGLHPALRAAGRTGQRDRRSEALIFSEAGPRLRGAEAAVQLANEQLEKAGRPAKLTLSAETRPMRGGVVLKNGLVETNCSIGTLVDGLRPELSGKVAGRLFG